MTGIKIASILSDIFSIIHEYPYSIATANKLLIYLVPSLNDLKLLFFSFSLIHVIPYSCGSINKGYLSELVKIVPFSIDTLSAGNFY